ncbi:G2/M phase-specific E3 ubiquitin-protein ligase-like [Dendronephthya gigantea]|uniref:G2/M phase-specific E3 ubiquitin-protein ligase-like n=1 Tax=Dendronephthya gigantea TaxID=151771 RepID=UPI00106CA9F6|nr:G2/M phase-specific E3 ubiquitin-protein ligase-like [Dendronephthya gigantea]
MADHKSGVNKQSNCKANFCPNCAFPVEKGYNFCPGCGNDIKTNANGDAEAKRELENLKTTNKLSLPSFALPSFAAFKTSKEKERQSFFSKKSGRLNKKRKVQVKEVCIQVGVMDDCLKIKRGETLPLKVNSMAMYDEILAAAIKKHRDFNKRFDSESNYQLVFKDGGDATTIPGTDPVESFTLQRYKELSGFGFSRIVLYLSREADNHDLDMFEDEETYLPPATWLTNSNANSHCLLDEKTTSSNVTTVENSKIVEKEDSMIPQTSSGVMHMCDPWIISVSDSSDDEELFTPISKAVKREEIPPCEDVLDVAALLRSHFTSNVLLSKTVTFVIRRSKPWKSFMRNVMDNKFDDSMNFEVKFSDSMETVDDHGPKREFLRVLRNDLVERSGIFQPTGKAGAYVLTHNAQKLQSHEYYLAGRAFATVLIFGGDPPCVLSKSIYGYMTVGYDNTQPSIDEIPYSSDRENLSRLMGTENQEQLSALLRDEAVSDLILDAGYQNLSFKFDKVKSVVDSVVKYLVIGKCSDVGSNRREKEEDIYEFWVSFVQSTSEPNSVVQPKDILRFASGCEREPLLGWGVDKHPALMFIAAYEEIDPLCESKLPQARTCGPTILLPTATYIDSNDFNDKMVTGIVNSPQILLV